jgi:hypothetical protein
MGVKGPTGPNGVDQIQNELQNDRIMSDMMERLANLNSNSNIDFIDGSMVVLANKFLIKTGKCPCASKDCECQARG